MFVDSPLYTLLTGAIARAKDPNTPLQERIHLFRAAAAKIDHPGIADQCAQAADGLEAAQAAANLAVLSLQTLSDGEQMQLSLKA